MEWTSSYHDTCLELAILEMREKEVRKRVEIAHGIMFDGEAISSGDYVRIPLDKAVIDYNKAVDDLNAIQDDVDRVKGVKDQMEQLMQQFGDKHNQIAYKRVIERKSIEEIAFEVDRSYSYVSKVSSQMKLKNAKNMKDFINFNVI